MGGWLAVLAILLVGVGPGLAVLGSWISGFDAASLLTFPFAFWSLLCGIKIFRRHSDAVRWALSFLWASAALHFLFVQLVRVTWEYGPAFRRWDPGISALAGAMGYLEDAPEAWDTIRALDDFSLLGFVLAGIWTLYLRRSRRAKETLLLSPPDELLVSEEVRIGYLVLTFLLGLGLLFPLLIHF